MLTLNGYPLAFPSPDLAEKIARDIPIERLALLYNRAWPGFGTVGIATPTHYRPWPYQPFRVNHFYWPTGASRYAFGLFLMAADQINQLEPVAFGTNSNQQNNVDLTMSSEDKDGTLVERIRTSVTVLPPIPIYRVLDTQGLSDHGGYLVVVVDQRFYWWNYPLPDLGITETAGKTWQNVFNAIASALNITITVDTIDTDYLAPSRALNLSYEAVPPLLDAVAWNVGHRLVVDPTTGNVSTQSFNTALSAYKNDQTNHPNRTLRAGGPRFLDQL